MWIRDEYNFIGRSGDVKKEIPLVARAALLTLGDIPSLLEMPSFRHTEFTPLKCLNSIDTVLCESLPYSTPAQFRQPVDFPVSSIVRPDAEGCRG